MKGEANIETLPQYIFVFANEVFDIIISIFRLPYIQGLDLIHYTPIYSLEKSLRLSLQNILRARSIHKKNGREDRQKTLLIYTKWFGQQGRKY